MPRKPSKDLLTLPGRMRAAIRATRAIMAEREVDVVVGFGGYVALPAYLAARGRSRSSSTRPTPPPGWPTRSAPGSPSRSRPPSTGPACKGARVVGNPVRRSLSELDRAGLRAQAREFFGLDPDAPTLLVFGGSQGAQRINAAVVGGRPGPRGGRHRGAARVRPAERDHRAANRPPAPRRMSRCRTWTGWTWPTRRPTWCWPGPGAMTVAEIAAVGLPAVYVPLPHGNGEQRLNASGQVASGAAIIIDDADLDREAVASKVIPLVIDGIMRDGMTAAAAQAATQRADDVIARMVLDAAAGAIHGRPG